MYGGPSQLNASITSFPDHSYEQCAAIGIIERSHVQEILVRNIE
jgi:hypothetical protein